MNNLPALTNSSQQDCYIPNGTEFRNCVNMWQHQPDLASEVEVLKLDICHKYDKRILCNLLPNLRVFRYREISIMDQFKYHCNKQFKLNHKNSKLESITDEGECELTRELLTSGSCTKLKYLELTLKEPLTPRGTVFIHLNNAPNLTTLILRHCQFGINCHEIIHHNLRSLETLELFRIKLIDNEQPKRYIIPAASVTTLNIDLEGVEDSCKYLNWFKYMAKKYTNLKMFHYDDHNTLYNDSIKTMKVYEQGVYPIYRNNGILIRFFKFTSIPADINPFATFDEFGVGISGIHLKHSSDGLLFNQLAKSHQSKHVQTLTLSYCAILSPMVLRDFTSLKELELLSHDQIYMNNANLSYYFNVLPPTLTTFRAELDEVVINEIPSKPNNVQCLSLICKTLFPKLGEAISRCFPKLNRLDVDGALAVNLNIDLPNNHFQVLSIVAQNTCDKPYWYKITNKTKSRSQYYNKQSGFNGINPVISRQLQSGVLISIHCGSVDTLYFDGSNVGSFNK